MKLSKITILFLVFTFASFGQQFESTVSAVDASLNTVKSSKKEYVQSITIISPAVIKITIDEIDNKGNNSSKSFILNPADIKKNAVKKVVKKDLIFVEIPTNQKLIKLTKEDGKGSYVNSFKLYATDINNARELVSKIKETIPIAKQIVDQRISLTTYQECLNWLENNIGNVSSANWDFTQNLQENAEHVGSVQFHETNNTSKSIEENSYVFNLFTLNPKTIAFKINGDLFSVFVETNKAVKVIKYLENDIQKNYTNKFTIACNDIEQARDLRKILQTIIPLAEESFYNSIIPVSSNFEGISQLNKLTGSFSFNDTSFKQRFTGECIIEYTKEYDSGDKTEISDFNFSLNDIDKHKINYSSKGAFLFVDLFTKNSEPFIKHTIDGEDIKYEKSVRIYVSSIENAIQLKQTIKDLIGLCAGGDEINETNYSQNDNSNNYSVSTDNTPTKSIKKSNLNFNNITIEEPSFMGQIVYVDNNTPVDLEENVYYVKQGASTGRKITGIGKVNATYIVEGNSSPVKIPQQERIYFVCNYGDNNYLPTKIIQVLKLEKEKRTREYIVSSSSNASGDTANNKFKFEKYKAKKYGEQSYIIEFTNLKPGEYAVSIGGEDSGTELYLFSIVE